MGSMTSRIHAITITCSNPDQLGAFWQQLLDLREDSENPRNPDDPATILVTEPIKVTFAFQPREEDLGFPRIHFDLDPVDLTRDEEVERLLGLGAELVADKRSPDGSGWVTMRDADGYEFCILRSEAERGAAGSE